MRITLHRSHNSIDTIPLELIMLIHFHVRKNIQKLISNNSIAVGLKKVNASSQTVSSAIWTKIVIKIKTGNTDISKINITISMVLSQIKTNAVSEIQWNYITNVVETTLATNASREIVSSAKWTINNSMLILILVDNMRCRFPYQYLSILAHSHPLIIQLFHRKEHLLKLLVVIMGNSCKVIRAWWIVCNEYNWF